MRTIFESAGVAGCLPAPEPRVAPVGWTPGPGQSRRSVRPKDILIHQLYVEQGWPVAKVARFLDVSVVRVWVTAWMMAVWRRIEQVLDRGTERAAVPPSQKDSPRRRRSMVMGNHA